MSTVSSGSILSVVKWVLQLNFFTLVSWISAVGLMFKFLRKEYVGVVLFPFICSLFGEILGIYSFVRLRVEL